MKKALLLVLFTLPAVLACYGQASYRLDKDTSKYKNSPIYILRYNKKADTTFTAALINPKDIDSIMILRITHPDHYTQNGVVNIKLKDNIDLVNLNQLFNYYHIALRNRVLPVFVDSAIALHAETMRVELNYVKCVKVEKEKGTSMKYISIISINPVVRPKDGEILIRGIAAK